MTINELSSLITKIEETFKYEGGSVDFISEFRTKVAEVQETHLNEGGQSVFSQSPNFIGSSLGITAMPTATIFTIGGSFGGMSRPDPNEILGPQTEAAVNKLTDWLKLEGKM